MHPQCQLLLSLPFDVDKERRVMMSMEATMFGGYHTMQCYIVSNHTF